jgi:hypothetical protein
MIYQMNGLCSVSEAAVEREISTLSVQNSHASGAKVSLEAGVAGYARRIWRPDYGLGL